MKKAAILLVFLSLLSSCPRLGDGSDRILKESFNKGHSKKAILFLREAGATVGDSYQVTLLDNDAQFDTTAVGNTFTVDDNHGKAALNPQSINFTWLDDDTLKITYDKRLRTFIQNDAVDNVVVIYQAR